MMAGSNMKGFVLAVGLFLLSWLTPLLQKAFYARAITLLLSCAGLCIVVPPHVWEVLMSCWWALPLMSSPGEPWAFADGLLAHSGGPMPQSQCRWGAGASQAQGSLPSLSSPPALHSKMDSRLVHLVLVSALCGPLLPIFIHKVLLAHSHPITDVVSVTALAQRWWRRGGAGRSAVWQANTEVFTVWPFPDQVCWPQSHL